jgi:hypothetical protein
VSSPIDLFRQGILAGDWVPVCDAFKMMTGQEIAVPSGLDPKTRKVLEDVHAFLGGYLFGVEGRVLPKAEFARPPAPVSAAAPVPASPEEDVLREEPTVRRPRSDAFTEQFRRRPTEGSGQQAQARPWTPPVPGQSRDRELMATLFQREREESIRMSQTTSPQPRRPPAERVAVVCCKCNKRYEVEPIFVPRSYDREDGPASYVCDSCIARNRRGAD